jgi:hypothetical protein
MKRDLSVNLLNVVAGDGERWQRLAISITPPDGLGFDLDLPVGQATELIKLIETAINSKSFNVCVTFEDDHYEST